MESSARGRWEVLVVGGDLQDKKKDRVRGGMLGLCTRISRSGYWQCRFLSHNPSLYLGSWRVIAGKSPGWRGCDSIARTTTCQDQDSWSVMGHWETYGRLRANFCHSFTLRATVCENFILHIEIEKTVWWSGRNTSMQTFTHSSLNEIILQKDNFDNQKYNYIGQQSMGMLFLYGCQIGPFNRSDNTIG